MFRVLTCISSDHDWRLVALAAMVCFLASGTAINLLRHARTFRGRNRAIALATAGTVTGGGIWATHFIGILAYNPGAAVGFDLPLTVLSAVAAIALTSLGFATAIVASGRWAAPAGGALVGLGIAGMHYLGMFALELPGRIVWAADLVPASFLFGVLFGAAALQAAVHHHHFRAQLAAAGLLTLAIISLHFTAMAAAEIIPHPTLAAAPSGLSPSALAWTVANATVAILGLSFGGLIADRRLRARDEQFALAVNNISQGVVMFDAAERLIICNSRFIDMYDLSPEIVKPGCTLSDLIANRVSSGTLARDPVAYRAELLEAMRRGDTTAQITESVDGRLFSVVSRPIAGTEYWVGTHEDITQLRRTEARIAHMAHHDALTGLWNRAAFTEYMAGALDRANGTDETFAVLCMNLDRFKEVNDIYGHGVGDALLREVAKRLQKAAGGAFLARIGGDEFTVISCEGAQPATAEALAHRLIAALADDIAIEGSQLRIGLSIGVAVYPSDGRDQTTVLGNADAALNRAKSSGRGTVQVFEADMYEELRDRRALQHDLRHALGNGDMILHYQPQAAMDGTITGFEALLRWWHPTKGMIAPDRFIPIAEESGLIVEIDAWVLRAACREAAAWPRPLHVAVNLSPIQFRQSDIVALVHTVLTETGLSPGRLELEITEGVLIEDFSRAQSILRRLKALGVRIAMDDFGTGYSSLSYLQSFPFDRIKIDKTFIAGVDASGQSAAIVRAVIGLSRGLHLPVIAEGVETAAQMDFLARESCDEVQGYLIGRPAPIAAYAEVIAGSAAPLRAAG